MYSKRDKVIIARHRQANQKVTADVLDVKGGSGGNENMGQFKRCLHDKEKLAFV